MSAFFGMNLIHDMSALRRQCYNDIILRHQVFEVQINKLFQLQRTTNTLFNLRYPMAEEQRQRYLERFRNELQKLIMEEESDVKRINVKCTQIFKLVMNNRMMDALMYTRSKLQMGIGEFVIFVNDVRNYGHEMDQGLYRCLDMYGSSQNDICMESEVQGVMMLIDNFVAQAIALLYINVDNSDAFFDEIFPRPEEMQNDAASSHDTVSSHHDTVSSHDETESNHHDTVSNHSTESQNEMLGSKSDNSPDIISTSRAGPTTQSTTSTDEAAIYYASGDGKPTTDDVIDHDGPFNNDADQYQLGVYESTQTIIDGNVPVSSHDNVSQDNTGIVVCTCTIHIILTAFYITL